MELGGVTEKKCNPITNKYTHNIDPILKLVSGLEVLDRKNVEDWASDDRTSEILEEVKTPKFDMLYQRFKPPDMVVRTNNTDINRGPNKLLNLSVLKTGGEFPHTNVVITDVPPSGKNKNEENEGKNEKNEEYNSSDNGTANSTQIERKAASKAPTSSPVSRISPVLHRDQATSPNFRFDEDTDHSIGAMQQLAAKLDANLLTKSIATATSPTISSKDIHYHDVDDSNVDNTREQQPPLQHQSLPQPSPFLSLSELDKDMEVPLSQMNVSMETSVNNDDIIDNILNRESLHFMQYISPCHSMINVLSNIRRRRLSQAMTRLCVNAVRHCHHRLPMMRAREVFSF